MAWSRFMLTSSFGNQTSLLKENNAINKGHLQKRLTQQVIFEMENMCFSGLRTSPTKIAENGYFGTKIVADPRDIFKKFFCPEIAETLFCNRSLWRGYPLRLCSSKLAFFEPRSPNLEPRFWKNLKFFWKIFFTKSKVRP